MIVWRSFERQEGFDAFLPYLADIKKDIRYTIRLQIDQDHGVTQRACRLAHLADGLFSGV